MRIVLASWKHREATDKDPSSELDSSGADTGGDDATKLTLDGASAAVSDGDARQRVDTPMKARAVGMGHSSDKSPLIRLQMEQNENSMQPANGDISSPIVPLLVTPTPARTPIPTPGSTPSAKHVGALLAKKSPKRATERKKGRRIKKKIVTSSSSDESDDDDEAAFAAHSVASTSSTRASASASANSESRDAEEKQAAERSSTSGTGGRSRQTPMRKTATKAARSMVLGSRGDHGADSDQEDEADSEDSIHDFIVGSDEEESEFEESGLSAMGSSSSGSECEE